MSKQSFIKFMETMIAQGNVPADVIDYFEKNLKAKKVNKKELEKAQTVKTAIVSFLQENMGTKFDRTEIGNALYNRAEFAEEYLLNEKGTVAYNSITAFANQLVTEGKLTKSEEKEGKVTKVKYTVIA